MTNTDNITLALLIILSINAFLFLGQYAVLQLNPEAPQVYNSQGSLLCQFDNDNCEDNTYILNDSDPYARLPNDDPSVTQTTGNPFVDIFSNIKSWLSEKTGAGYVMNILSAPKNLLQAIGLPEAFTFVIAGLWYGLTLFYIVAFLWGR